LLLKTIQGIWHSSCFGIFKNEINTMLTIEIKTQQRSVNRLTFACISLGCLLAATTAVDAAADTDESQGAPIDSVYSWGQWELGLEPASGVEVPADTKLGDRSRQLQFRPNDNAAYVPTSIPLGTGTPTTPPAPAPIPVISVGGTGPILPGMVPNPPNLR
jgi:hypothetical protein